jgi:hypothetical protein
MSGSGYLHWSYDPLKKLSFFHRTPYNYSRDEATADYNNNDVNASKNPVDTRRDNNGIIVNDSISIHHKESIKAQSMLEPCSVNQHHQGDPPNIDSATVESAPDNNNNDVVPSSGIQQQEMFIAASSERQHTPDVERHLRDTFIINCPSMPNSAHLHRTVTANNVEQNIDQNIKVLIIKMFERRDKELNTFKCKVDKLNNDCAVSKKKINDQLRGLRNGLSNLLKKYITKHKNGQ